MALYSKKKNKNLFYNEEREREMSHRTQIPRYYGESENESSSLRCIRVTNMVSVAAVIGFVVLTGTYSVLPYIL